MKIKYNNLSFLHINSILSLDFYTRYIHYETFVDVYARMLYFQCQIIIVNPVIL